MDEPWDDEGRRLALYETVLQTIHDAVYTLDPDGVITWVNRTAVEGFELGYTRDDLVGSPVSLVLGEADIQRATEIIGGLLDGEDAGRCEVAIQTAHGTEIPCELDITLLPAPDGSFRGTVGVLREITQRRQREQRLAVLNRVLRHDTRNELAVIVGEAHDLEVALEGEAAEKAARIRARGEGFVALAEKARRVERSLEGADGRLAAVDVVDLVRAAVARVGETHPAADVDLDVPASAAVLANDSLGIAVEELLENAVEHGGAATVVVEAAADRVTVRIDDDGPPIPEAELAVLESGDETPLRHASGLGLWVANWLVEGCAGGLAFDRRPDGGNRLTIRLQPAPQG